MSAEPMLSGGHDFIEASELAVLEDRNKAFKEACYLEDVALVRADLLGRLAAFGISGRLVNQAIFVGSGHGDLVDPVHSDETSGTKRILAVTYKSKYARPTKPPTIRMFTAESGSNELGLYSITEEVGISPDGHMQHFMDAATMSYEGRTISRSSSQIFFVTQEGSLAMPNYRPNPAQYALVAVVDGVPFSAVPFGHAESEEDQLFALGRAQDLVSQIQAMEPVFGVYRD